ncbi:MAG: hypothetical protein ACRDGB_05735 [Candidatus Limnocylindria bacterium]
MQLVLLVRRKDKNAIALERDVYLELQRRMAERLPEADRARAIAALQAAGEELEAELTAYGESLERQA